MCFVFQDKIWNNGAERKKKMQKKQNNKIQFNL